MESRDGDHKGENRIPQYGIPYYVDENPAFTAMDVSILYLHMDGATTMIAAKG